MKKIVLILTAIIAFISTTHAEIQTITGEIKFIRYHDKVAFSGTGWEGNYWIKISATQSSTCTCAKNNENNSGGDGYAFFVDGSDKNLVAFLLAAKTSGAVVSIYYDSSKTTMGFCRLQYVGY